MNHKIFHFLSILLVCFLCHTSTKAQNTLQEKSVRFVYLVSKDRKLNMAYKAGIEMAAKDIQNWYSKQLDGVTFKLNSPIVEVVYSDKKASYFYSHPNGDNKRAWGYKNTFEECQRLIGVKHFDPNYIWVIYSDGPGNAGMGGSGVCIMPEDDLLGLIGKHPTQPDINRWIAGLGHEAGHAFGLAHPKDTQKDADAIMWTGIYGGKYPDVCYLTPEDKAILLESPFFFDAQGQPIIGKLSEKIRFGYAQGEFIRYQNSKTNAITWIENTQGGSTFHFTELRKDTDFYYLRAKGRNIDIRIPCKGGDSQLSTNQGNTWGFFQKMSIL